MDSLLAPAWPGTDLEALAALLARVERAISALPTPPIPAAGAAGAVVRYYARDGSVFVDGEYLVKGVAGAIFWKLVRELAATGRGEFSTRELRLAGQEIGLPDAPADNLDARLLLLRRRLIERDAPARIEQTGRGRYRLVARRPLLAQTETPVGKGIRPAVPAAPASPPDAS